MVYTTCVNSYPQICTNMIIVTMSELIITYGSVAVGSNLNWQTSSLYTKDNLSVKVVLNGISSSLMSSAGEFYVWMVQIIEEILTISSLYKLSQLLIQIAPWQTCFRWFQEQ